MINYLKKYFIPIFILFFIACSKEGTILNGTSMYKNKKLTKKIKKIKLKRGTVVKVEDNEGKICKISYKDKFKGYILCNKVYTQDLEIVTFVRPAELKSRPDLLSKAPVINKKTALSKFYANKVGIGTKAYLLKEHKVWSLIDLGEVKGWVLKEKLFKGDGLYKLSINVNKLVVDIDGNWHTPYISGERFFSIEKAFDLSKETFSLIRKGDLIKVNIRNYHNKNDKYVLRYNGKDLVYKYRKLALPKAIKIIIPNEKNIKLTENSEYIFQGNVLQFKVTQADKDLVILNQFEIKSLIEE